MDVVLGSRFSRFSKIFRGETGLERGFGVPSPRFRRTKSLDCKLRPCYTLGMAVPVLVMTPVRSFGELIQQALQETGLYQATLVHDNEQALASARQAEYPVAVLDFDLEDHPAELVNAILAIQPEMRIIAIRNTPEGERSLKEDLPLAACLEEAFYLPDLLDILARVSAGVKGSAHVSKKSEVSAFPTAIMKEERKKWGQSAPVWLQDVERAAQQLTRLSLESAAQAALITRGEKLWAYAGQLPQPAAEELAQTVGQYWAADGRSDLARFIRLEATNEEYMLYATGLGGDFALALVYETEIPFSQIRHQAGDLARRLSSPPEIFQPPSEETALPEDDAWALPESPLEENNASPDIRALDDLLPPEPSPQKEVDGVSPFTMDEPAEEDALVVFPTDWRPHQDIAEGRQAFFEELLASVEFPDPEATGELSASHEVQVWDKPATDDESVECKTPESVPGSPPPPGKGDDRPASEEEGAGFDLLASTGLHEELSHGQLEAEEFLDLSPPLAEVPQDPKIPSSEEQGELPEEAQPAPAQEEAPPPRARRLISEDFFPETPGFHNLTYACVLLPRFPQHHLAGDVAQCLTEWVAEICLAFGWRLQHLDVRPPYLHWVVVVPPSVSPGTMVHTMREHLSQRVFVEFPRFAKMNPSGDFWAPGSLIVNGVDPLAQHLIMDYLDKTRRRQGVKKP